MGEAAKIMPVFRALAESRPNEKFAIPTTITTDEFIRRETKTWRVQPELVPFSQRYELFGRAKFAVATSGTAVSELAIMRIPAIVVYRANWLTHLMAKFVLRTKSVSLVNIMSGKVIYPELLGGAATAENILRVWSQTDLGKMEADLTAAERLWHKTGNPAAIIANELK